MNHEGSSLSCKSHFYKYTKVKNPDDEMFFQNCGKRGKFQDIFGFYCIFINFFENSIDGVLFNPLP